MQRHTFILLTRLTFFFPPQLYSSVDFGRKWQLIHEHVTPNRFYWWVILVLRIHSSSPKFCLLRNAGTVACVPRDWASDIDGLEQGVWLTGDAAEFLHIIFPPPWYNQAEINLLPRAEHTLHSAVRGHVTSHFVSHTRPAHIRHIAHKYKMIMCTSTTEGEGAIPQMHTCRYRSSRTVWGAMTTLTRK